jgi:hypothetical protein
MSTTQTIDVSKQIKNITKNPSVPTYILNRLENIFRLSGSYLSNQLRRNFQSLFKCNFRFLEGF